MALSSRKRPIWISRENAQCCQGPRERGDQEAETEYNGPDFAYTSHGVPPRPSPTSFGVRTGMWQRSRAGRGAGDRRFKIKRDCLALGILIA